VSSGLFGLPLTHAVPALGRNIGGLAEREPHLPNVVATGERLLCRVPPERTQHEIAREHPPITLAELIGNGRSKLTQTHMPSLEGNDKRPGGAGAFGVSRLARNEIDVYARDEIVWQSIRDSVESLDDRQAITDLTHHYGDGDIERLRY